MKQQFISSQLFSTIRNTTLDSNFNTLKKIAHFSNLEFDKSLVQMLDPKLLFEKLQYGIIKDLDLLQTFTLMGWDDNLWKIPTGYKAMQNWWLSAFHQEDKGDKNLRIVMILRIVLADTERYPAPKDVVQLMGKVFQDLFESGKCNFKIDYDVLNAIVSKIPKELAKISFLQKKSVIEVIQASGFPNKLPIIEDANEEWLKLWFHANHNQRTPLNNKLIETLNTFSNLNTHIRLTNLILNDINLPRDIFHLKQEVKKFPEIAEWLKKVKSVNKSKNTLIKYYQSLHPENAKQLLSCWIGVGNYEQLKVMIYNLADLHYSDNDEWTIKSRKAQKNRYLFWEDYQFFFEEIWLLLPQKYQYISEKYAIDNIRNLEGFYYPIAVFKIGSNYIFQPFVSKATQANLFAINDSQDELESLLNEPNISMNQLLSRDVIFKHEHNLGWQPELREILKNKMAI